MENFLMARNSSTVPIGGYFYIEFTILMTQWLAADPGSISGLVASHCFRIPDKKKVEASFINYTSPLYQITIKSGSMK